MESKDDKDDDSDNNKEYKSKLIKKKIKKGYLLGKILPWGTPKQFGQELYSASTKKINGFEIDEQKKYYDKKVDDLINSDKNKNKDNNLYNSGKAFFRKAFITSEDNELDIKDKTNEKR